jgi:GntR family transcriptional regulator
LPTGPDIRRADPAEKHTDASLHVVFDIDIQRDPAGPAPAVGPPSSPAAGAPESVADRARRLGEELLRLADDLSH